MRRISEKKWHTSEKSEKTVLISVKKWEADDKLMKKRQQTSEEK